MNNQQRIIGNIFDDNIHFDVGFAIEPAINELKENVKNVGQNTYAQEGVLLKNFLSRLPNQSLPDVNCEIEKIS